MDTDSGNIYSLIEPKQDYNNGLISNINPFNTAQSSLNPLSGNNSIQLPNIKLEIPETSKKESFVNNNSYFDFLTGLNNINNLIASENLTSTSKITHSAQLGEVFVVPGSPLETVDLLFQWTYRKALYDNEIGFFEVDENGFVEGVAPTASNYTLSALSSPTRQVIFNSGQQTGNYKQLQFTGGTHLAFYLIEGNTTENWLSLNPTNDISAHPKTWEEWLASNLKKIVTTNPVAFLSVNGTTPDLFDHVNTSDLGEGIWRLHWEDLTNGGDADFDDVVMNISQPGLISPGETGQSVPLTVKYLGKDGQNNSEMGFYWVDDREGRIGNLFPGDERYIQAALREGQYQILTYAGELTETTQTIEIPSGKYIGWYLINGGTTSQLRATNPTNNPSGGIVAFFSYSDNNTDGLSHVHHENSHQLVWESTSGGGDRDYNDKIIEFEFGTPVTYSLSIDDLTVTETDYGVKEAIFNVNLSKPHILPVNVDFSVEGITALIGEDFQGISGTLNFTPGETLKTITVSINGDLIDESNETFRVNLNNANNAVISKGAGIGTIIDNDNSPPPNPPPPNLPTISINNISVTEGDTSDTEAEFIISLSSPSNTPVTVNYQTVGVSAASGEDFQPREGTLTFNSSETEKRLKVTINGDLIDENDETFNLVLNNPTSATVINSIGTGTIIDNDNSTPPNQPPNPPPTTPKISINSVEVIEGDSSSTEAEFIISLSSPSNKTVTVNYQTVGVSATSTEDFEAISGTLTFLFGETEKRLKVTIKGDLIDENDETFNLVLSNPTNARLVNNIGLGTIIDNDNNTPENHSPNAEEDKTLILEQGSEAISLSITAPTDSDGDNLTITVEEIPLATAGVALLNEGTTVNVGQQLTIAQLTSLVFTPIMGITGDAGRFRYTVSDGKGGTDSQTISFFITAIVPEIDLVENSDFEVIHSQVISISATSSILNFTINNLNFDTESQNTINDAFEVALIDGEGNSLVHSIFTGLDAFYNATEGQSVIKAPGVTQFNQTISVNLTGLISGEATLIFRLINNDTDTLTSVGITNISITPGDGTPIPTVTPLVTRTNNNVIDLNLLEDVSGSLKALYEQTSFNDKTSILSTTIKVQNTGTYWIDAPLIVAIDKISDPTVQLIDVSGITPDGLPYYDLSHLISNGKLSVGAITQGQTIKFFNPTGEQFTYKLVFRSLLNDNLVITSNPDVEVLKGKTYIYDVNATDSNGDSLTYSLVTSPNGMTINPNTGLINWTPDSNAVGNWNISVQVDDSRGGIEGQNYNLSVIEAPPNRPPVFTSIPIVDTNINKLYQYQATATDPDSDVLSYSLVEAPLSMTINSNTGLINWTPTGNQHRTHQITLSVNDSHGGTALQTYNLVVNNEEGNHNSIIISEPITRFNLPGISNHNEGNVNPLHLDFNLAFTETIEKTVSIQRDIETVPMVDVFLLFEEYGSKLDRERPFILNQPIITTTTPLFTEAIESALDRTAPGGGRDTPETLIEALYQTATGEGFDGNNDGDTTDSGPAGRGSTQTNPGKSGDVPAFSSFISSSSLDDAIKGTGTRGGAGFRAGALPIILAATDTGTVYQPDEASFITGINGITVPLSQLTSYSRPSTPLGTGATIQETINALLNIGALVIGLGTNREDFKAPRQTLEAIATLTGAVNSSNTAINSGIEEDPINSGDPFYFLINPSSSQNLAQGLTSAIISAITSTASNINVISSDDLVIINNKTGIVTNVKPGEQATFNLEFTGDGIARSFDLLFVQPESSLVLG